METGYESKKGKKRQNKAKEFFCLFYPFFAPFCFSFFPPKVS